MVKLAFMAIKHIRFSSQRAAKNKYFACPISASVPTGCDTDPRAARLGQGLVHKNRDIQRDRTTVCPGFQLLNPARPDSMLPDILF